MRAYLPETFRPLDLQGPIGSAISGEGVGTYALCTCRNLQPVDSIPVLRGACRRQFSGIVGRREGYQRFAIRCIKNTIDRFISRTVPDPEGPDFCLVRPANGLRVILQRAIGLRVILQRPGTVHPANGFRVKILQGGRQIQRLQLHIDDVKGPCVDPRYCIRQLQAFYIDGPAALYCRP